VIIAVLSLLIFHGMLGGLDVLVNHELIEHLPSRIAARTEEALHSLRELLFALLFGGFAWFRWGGELVWCIVLLLLGELIVSLTDSLVEDDTRRLSAAERTMHVLLLINFGAYTSMSIPVLVHWYVMPTGLELAYYGWRTWVLTALAAASFAWCLRDAYSWAMLGRKNKGSKMRATIA
jgi:hypothetical protein